MTFEETKNALCDFLGVKVSIEHQELGKLRRKYLRENCAYLGIPCIGYEGLDTQEICHPDTTVKLGDLKKARDIAKELRNNEEFYVYCSKLTKEKYLENYHENKFNTTFKKQFKIP